MTPEEYDEVERRALLKVGIAFGVPSLVALIVYWRSTWPYAVAVAVIVSWALLVDRLVDRMRDRRSPSDEHPTKTL